MDNSNSTTLEITDINADWRKVKNRCRTTMGKNATGNEATKYFVKKILISEHSPIRLVTIDFSWKNLKSWIATHFSRHHVGWEKWISTQRNDRTNVDRDKSPQDTPVKMDVCANAQGLINVARYRLCYMAHKETREKMEELKCAIKESGQEEIANVMQKNCIYRCGCPEFESCGYWKAFCEKYKDENLLNIQTRYDLADKDFYETVTKKSAK